MAWAPGRRSDGGQQLGHGMPGLCQSGPPLPSGPGTRRACQKRGKLGAHPVPRAGLD